MALRQIILGAGLFGMVAGAVMGIVAGDDLRSCVQHMRVQGENVAAYNALVPVCNQWIQLRSFAFGIVIVGAILSAAPAGYDALSRATQRSP